MGSRRSATCGGAAGGGRCSVAARYCNGTRLVLHRYCTRAALVLHKHNQRAGCILVHSRYTRTPIALHRHRAGKMLTLHCCTGAILALYWQFAGTAVALHRYCFRTTPVLNKYHNGAVLVRSWCCTEPTIVLVQRQPATSACLWIVITLAEKCQSNTHATPTQNRAARDNRVDAESLQGRARNELKASRHRPGLACRCLRASSSRPPDRPKAFRSNPRSTKSSARVGDTGHAGPSSRKTRIKCGLSVLP